VYNEAIDGCSDWSFFMTVSVLKHLDSDTVHLPEAQGLIGKDVRIILIEEPVAKVGVTDLSALDQIAGKVDLDYQAIEDLRRISIV
jgi:hypothetical protein